MKIRYVYDQLLPSRDTDTEQVLNTIAALGRRGVEVELVVPRAKGAPALSPQSLRDYYQVNGPLQVSEVPAEFGQFRTLQKLAHGFRSRRGPASSDLTYTRNLHVVAFALRSGQRVAYEHFRPWADQYPPLEPVLRWMLRHERFLGAVLHSAHILPSYLRLGAPKERLLVAHNGYEPRRMEPRLTQGEARRLLDLPLEGQLVVYTGRVSERKGLGSVLELARRLPEARFVLVGSEGEGAIEQQARYLANVIVRPWQPFDATVRYLYAADALIIPPSLAPLERHGNTVLPMKLFLYLASGRALVAPRAPDTAELLEHDVNALLLPPDDPDAQSRALGALLADDQRRRRLSDGAMSRAASLTWDARAEKIEAFLRERAAAGPSLESAHDWSVGGWITGTLGWLDRRARNG